MKNVYTFKDISRHLKIGIFFVVKLNLGDSSSCYLKKINYLKMSLNPRCLKECKIVVANCLWKLALSAEEGPVWGAWIPQDFAGRVGRPLPPGGKGRAYRVTMVTEGGGGRIPSGDPHGVRWAGTGRGP